MLFFVTFLPQFIDARDPHASAKLFLLGFGFIAVTTIVNAAVILVAARFVAAAKREPARVAPVRLRLRRADGRLRVAARVERGEIGRGRWTFPRFALPFPPRPPPPGLDHALKALWLDAKGDWDGAHEAAQADEGGAGDWVHAYLHRKEGDAGNAAYWYRRAGKPVCRTSLDEEWAAIAESLLRQRSSSAPRS